MAENKFTILIVEDDEQINDALKIYLLKKGYNTIQAYDGKKALDKFTSKMVDLILLDISLPEIDGMQVLKQVRTVSDVPIIMLTVFSKEYDKLKGFDLGADDYITKPFSFKEVIARIQAVLNRVKKLNVPQTAYINIGKIRINSVTREVFLDNTEILLTKKEFDLLFTFVNNHNITFSREKLLEKIWNNKDINDFRTVDTHIKQLREKLGCEKGCIQTVWGVGYRLKVTKNE
ncbi:transcriptional regulatory protein SrrA [Clostridium saccharobutylicum]|uniref:response regulator transcription factor n=1 Tax=Clostridium saccharobutylicum TaxID=169679 RepID=UPI000983C141|nr:response regulator transcription factor [Clostridium saccharobutylicum]AQS11362.1 transcriptional regulatory protein SrrA [Clostridium saccharobutylicum]MBC2437985.1 response regulator transcription factor [Clostridium saccharobutylicum]NSB88759.1 DNA-binding response OmpR family regulator [Clostridium saccharobutylicum]NYC30663.1 DNA-binding response OmpR family regulator [Clostridium saccharobutylicum]OOM16981.1 transcriptional regulatory protein SrrA [Clostridium saccharobutylicum]